MNNTTTPWFQTRYEIFNSNIHLIALLDTTLCDKVYQWLATGRWYFLGTPVSSTNKTDQHNITEILLKVASNTINQTLIYLRAKKLCRIIIEIKFYIKRWSIPSMSLCNSSLSLNVGSIDISYIVILSSVLWCSLRFPHKKRCLVHLYLQLFVGGSCLIYVISVCLYI